MITPISQLAPGEFTLKSYVGTTYTYLIDRILLGHGLVPIFECLHPCRTCVVPFAATVAGFHPLSAVPGMSDCTKC